MPKKWKLYPPGAKLICKDTNVPIEIIDYLDISGKEAVYRCKTDSGEIKFCTHSELVPPEK